MRRHPDCVACSGMSDAQLNAEDGIARHNSRTKVAEVPRLVERAVHQTSNGQWQAAIAYFDEAIRELQDARRLALAMAHPTPRSED